MPSIPVRNFPRRLAAHPADAHPPADRHSRSGTCCSVKRVPEDTPASSSRTAPPRCSPPCRRGRDAPGPPPGERLMEAGAVRARGRAIGVARLAASWPSRLLARHRCRRRRASCWPRPRRAGSDRPPRASAFDGEATWAAGAHRRRRSRPCAIRPASRFSLASLRGRTVAIEFFDSHCTQECPLEGRALAAAERSLPRAQRPVLVVVSVNPLDTPASTRAAMRAWGLAALAPVALADGHATPSLPPCGAPTTSTSRRSVDGDISHTEALYLVDTPRLRALGLPVPVPPGFVTHDLRALAARQAEAA